METPVLIQEATVENRQYIVGIYNDDNKLLVRKTEMMAGLKVPIDETYVLNIYDATSKHIAWITLIKGFCKN